MRLFKKQIKKAGFTLIETMVTLSIMASVTAASYPYVIKKVQQAQADKISGVLKQISEGAQNYYADQATPAWPGGTDCSTAIADLVDNGYIPATIDRNGIYNGSRQISTKCTSDNIKFSIGVTPIGTNSTYKKAVNDMVKASTPSWDRDDPTGTVATNEDIFYTTTLRPEAAAGLEVVNNDITTLKDNVGNPDGSDANSLWKGVKDADATATTAADTAQDALDGLDLKADLNGNVAEDFSIKDAIVTTINGVNINTGGGTGGANLAIGDGSLNRNTTGKNNTASGHQSLYSNTTGRYNTASGYVSLFRNTTGSFNTASGVSSLNQNTTGSQNTANGYSSLNQNTTGANNTASGYQSLTQNTTGGNNTASGVYSLNQNTTGQQNTASGSGSLQSNTTGGNNTATGYQSLKQNTTGYNNTASGSQSLNKNTSGSSNTASGYQSLTQNTTGSDNTASGHQSLYSNTTGSNNTANGRGSLHKNTTGTNNTASGVYSLYNNNTGTQNTASGYGSLNKNTSGTSNTASGYQSLSQNTTGGNNTASGPYSLYSNTTGGNNTATGYQSLTQNTTGSYNTANGRGSLHKNTTGTNNTASGVYSLYNNTTGHFNTASGYGSLNKNTSGGSNTASGNTALRSNETGSYNVVMGSGASYNSKSASGNVAIGTHTLMNNISGSYNTALGHEAGFNATGTKNTFIGFNAGKDEAGSNKLYIANSGTTTPLIHGDFSTKKVTINDDLEAKGTITADTFIGDGSGLTGLASSGAPYDSGVLTVGDGSSKAKITFDEHSGTQEGYIEAQHEDTSSGTPQAGYSFHFSSNQLTTNVVLDDGGKFIGDLEGIASGNPKFDDLDNMLVDLDLDYVRKAGDIMTGTLRINSLDTGNPENTITDSLRVSGYGIQGNRDYLYMTNAKSSGDIVFGIGGKHNDNVKMRIDSAGTVTISGDLTVSSDERLKSNIKPLENALDKLKDIRGVSYNKKPSNKAEIGVIAQEVEKHYPELINHDDDGMKSVNYNGLIGVLIESVKQLSSEMNILRAETHRLRQELKVLNQKQ